MNIDTSKINDLSENPQLPIPWEMPFQDFSRLYHQVMKSVASKEKQGQLDPDASPYIPMTEQEKELLKRDWKDFSRQRGFSEQDIAEYEIWLILSGQRDNLPLSINDPWRRTRTNWDKTLWLHFIEFAQSHNQIIPENLKKEYEILKNPQQTVGRTSLKNIPSPTEPVTIKNISKSTSEQIDEVW